MTKKLPLSANLPACLIAGSLILLSACSGTPKAVQYAKVGNAQGLIVDPACLTSVAWFADREAEDIKLTGCRSAAQLSARDENGWLLFEGEYDQRFWVRNEKRDPQTGAVSFEVRYNGGGTLTGLYQVSGVPTANGVLKTGKYSIKPLN
jgi:hypothetical protein